MRQPIKLVFSRTQDQDPNDARIAAAIGGKRGSYPSLGENVLLDEPFPVADDINAMGAGALYALKAARPWALVPQYLRSSNKPSETNICNTFPAIVVAQLAPMTSSNQARRMLSRRSRFIPKTAGG